MLSTSEQLAERSFVIFEAGRMGATSLYQHFECLLQRPDNIGAYYLVWLLLREPHANFELLKTMVRRLKA